MVADVDGTLVGPSGAPSAAVIAAARGVGEAGIRVGFATGRMRLAVAGLQDALALPGPHVLHNGAEVRADRRTIAAWPLRPHDIEVILDLADTLDLYVELYVDEGFVVSRWDERARPHWDLLGHEPLGVVTSQADVDGPILKATYGLFDPDDIDRIVPALMGAGLAAGPAGSPVTPTIHYVNATSASVDKGAAVTAAAAHLGVSLAAVVAIGDADNDASMLAVAGTSIAMGQAHPELQAGAHLVAPDVDDDGVATVLDWLATSRTTAG